MPPCKYGGNQGRGRGEKVARGGRGVEGEVREGKGGWYDGGVGV